MRQRRLGRMRHCSHRGGGKGAVRDGKEFADGVVSTEKLFLCFVFFSFSLFASLNVVGCLLPPLHVASDQCLSIQSFLDFIFWQS